MKAHYIVPMLALVLLGSCLNIEEEPILLINPTTEISAHIKNERIYATALVSVNPQVLTSGNIPTIFEFLGELAIYNTMTGNIIDVNAFTGGGQSQVYTVTADTASHDRFVVIATGTINAYADIGNDADPSNDRLISSGDFHEEATFIIADFFPETLSE
ncbi:MAG: hypothetical protein ABFS38_04875 [Bacteroidota bacterium]